MTGRGNEESLATLRYLLSEQPTKTIVRIPVIPGFNHDRESMGEIFRFLKKNRCESEIELLPFHNLGSGKYLAMDKKNEYCHIPSLAKSDLEAWRQVGSDLGLNIRIGAV